MARGTGTVPCPQWVPFFRLSVSGFLVVLAGLALSAGRVEAESYLSSQLGVTLPQPLSGVETTGAGVTPGTTSSDLDLQTSFLYGAKLGHYFDSLPWLGVETEGFTTTPHIKQQTAIVNEPGVGSGPVDFTGRYFRATTWAFNVLARYPGELFQPYAGIGLGIFFASLKDAQTGDTQSSTDPGLNALLGLRYLLTRKVILFGEWKFNHARFNFPETTNLTGQNVTYNAQHLVFGVGFRF